MPSAGPDWTVIVQQYHALGIWHAVQYLKGISNVRDPIETARDAMQDAWIRLMRRGIRPGDSVKALVIVHALSSARMIARMLYPISTIRGVGTQGRKTKGQRVKTFPVQIFGTTLDEITMLEEIRHPGCGDE